MVLALGILGLELDLSSIESAIPVQRQEASQRPANYGAARSDTELTLKPAHEDANTAGRKVHLNQRVIDGMTTIVCSDDDEVRPELKLAVETGAMAWPWKQFTDSNGSAGGPLEYFEPSASTDTCASNTEARDVHVYVRRVPREGGIYWSDKQETPSRKLFTVPPAKQYRIDITPVTLRGEMAEGAKLTVCIKMRDVFPADDPDGDANWRAFYIPCTPALLGLPIKNAPPVIPTVNIVGAAGGDEGQGSVFFIKTNPKPKSPLQVNVEVTATGDFGVTTGTRTITIPTTGKYDLNIATVGDEVDEDDGTVTLTLREGNGYQVGPGNTEVTDVFDNDLPLRQAEVTPEVNVTGPPVARKAKTPSSRWNRTPRRTPPWT